MTPQRKARMEAVLNRRQPDLTVVLENVHDTHNISAVLRTADAVGVAEVFVLNTRISAPTYFGKNSSSSAAKWMSVRCFSDVQDCMAALRQNNLRVFATHLSAGATSLYALDLCQPVALVFGNEHDGISEEILALCDGNFIIPQVGMVPCLNISVACAVSLYEAFRQRQAAGGYYNGSNRLSAEKRAEIKAAWGLEDTAMGKL